MNTPEYVGPGCSAIRQEVNPTAEARKRVELPAGHYALKASEIDTKHADLIRQAVEDAELRS